MLTISRGLAAALLVLGLAGTAMVSAQAPKKEEPKKTADPKDPKAKAKEEARERSVGFGTSDGLSLSGYWFQGTATDKQQPDAVMMFPSPDGKVNDAWIALAKSLSEKNFSVLLFDWRGVGANGVEGAGSRILEDKDKFWKEPFNGNMLMRSKKIIEDKGLDWKQLRSASVSKMNYKHFMLNDLLAARFFLDQQNDAGRCNTNRIWIVSEKDGASAGLGFIAAEFQRNSIYDPKQNVFDVNDQFKPAGKDYAGFVALSLGAPGNMTATGDAIFRGALPANGNQNVLSAMEHLESRLAMVMINQKGTGGGAMAVVRKAAPKVRTDEMKERFKYLQEFETKAAKVPTGIDLIDPADSFKVKETLMRAMVELSKDRQNFGKTTTNRDAAKIVNVPRFEVEKFLR